MAMLPSLRDWLTARGLAEFEPILAENQVDLHSLPLLTELDLKELGLPLGPRKRILKAIEELKHEPAPQRIDVAAPAKPAASFGERRQLTVMFCDLVGSTALSTLLDPEELDATIKTYRASCAGVVERYEGHVAQYLGDGLLVYFGWPVAHEDDAERAARSALEVVEAVKTIPAIRPLEVRIGLATGSVVVGETSPHGSSEPGLAVGETPNVAARLLAIAEPGEVVIANATRRLLGNTFSLTDLGVRSVKGIARPVHPWRIDEVRRTGGRFKAARDGAEIASLVGREEEVALLERSWRRACAGSGQVVHIGGQAGIGKSRLVQHLCEAIAPPHTGLQYQCSPYHLNSPLYPFIEELEGSAGFTRDDSPAQRLEKVEAVLSALSLPLPDVVPLLAALLSLPAPAYPPVQLSPQKKKERTLEALLARIEALAAAGCRLMIVEDVHWIDPTSQELLNALVNRVNRLPLLLVLTHRLEYRPPWTDNAGAESLLLQRLDRKQGVQLVNRVTKGKALPPELLDEILARTDGVPLFVEELTRSVLESGALREEEGHFVLQTSTASLAIPASLRDSLMARLDRLGAAKELAQIGACIGREFSFELLQHVSTLPPDVLQTDLRKVVRAELVTPNGEPPSAVYTFKHALVQDAAYESLLKKRRSELHARIAQALETHFADRAAAAPESLAHHYTEAGQFEPAIPLWRKAGTLAVARVALKEAVAHFSKGLALIDQLPPSPDRNNLELTIREPLNAAYTGLRGWAAREVYGNAQAILPLAESTANRRSLLLALWWVWSSTITQGRIADSRVWVDRLLAEATDAGDIDLRIFSHGAAMVEAMLNGRLLESREQAEKALALYDPGSATRWIQIAGHDLRSFVEVYTCQLLWVLGYPDQARRLSDQAVQHAREAGHAFNLVWAMVFSAYVFAYGREPGRLFERVEEADRLANEQGLTFIHEVSAPQAKGIAELENGRPAEAISLLRRGIENWTKTGGNVRIPLIKAALADAVSLQGDSATALGLIDECIDQIELPEGQERLWLSEVLRSKGVILMRAGRHDEAEKEVRASIDVARRQHAKSWELRSSTVLAELLAGRGQAEAAHDLLAEIYAWFKEGNDTKDLIEARQLLDRLAVKAEAVRIHV